MYLNLVQALNLVEELWDFLFFLNSSFMNKQVALVALANLPLSCFVHW